MTKRTKWRPSVVDNARHLAFDHVMVLSKSQFLFLYILFELVFALPVRAEIAPSSGSISSAVENAKQETSPAESTISESQDKEVAKPTEATEPTSKEASKPPIAAAPSQVEKPDVDTLKKACDALYSSRLQSELRANCLAGANWYFGLQKKPAQTECRLTYGNSARGNMSCLIGVSVGEDFSSKKKDFEFNKKLAACSAHYPSHSELDDYLLESCLTGIFFPLTLGKNKFSLCREVSPERSFLGPCGVGISLTSANTLSPDAHNKLCDQYFDHRQLHQGYRACLNARGLPLEQTKNIGDLLSACEQIVSDAKSELERAACVVGVSIYKNLSDGKATNKRFEKCGTARVSYDERDTLACLAAASFLDLSDKANADRACKTLFSDRKSESRGNCEKALETL